MVHQKKRGGPDISSPEWSSVCGHRFTLCGWIMELYGLRGTAGGSSPDRSPFYGHRFTQSGGPWSFIDRGTLLVSQAQIGAPFVGTGSWFLGPR